jgi:hypothetical protein
MGNKFKFNPCCCEFLIGGHVLETDPERFSQIQKSIVAKGILQLLCVSDGFLDSFGVQKFH